MVNDQTFDKLLTPVILDSINRNNDQLRQKYLEWYDNDNDKAK